ncbi:MAG: C-terminal target protein [Bacteroidetes bacterium]|nr:C-terminal target protein [Bacteroidota bacterium]
MTRYLLLAVLFVVSFSSYAAGDKIKAYFNTPVDTTFARHGNNAVYLNYTLDDTLIAYINRATQTLDIAIYQFSQGSGMADIAGAINSAYGRGVTVRLIYDGKDNASNSIGLLNAGIHTLASPGGSGYNIMHNKFMIIDVANSSNATVWTGSTNWSELMFDRDVNNAVIIQDQPLAQAYLAEFEQMWGSTTATPNATNAKFGPFKTATTAHTFTIDGKTVQLYFSPSDNTNDQIVTAINTADKQLFFGVYTFTESPNANAISAKYSTAGMTVKGIMDEFSIGYSAYNILSPLMGSDLKIYSQSNKVYHSKMMVVDPDYPAMDPLVLTGSHNWSVTADTKNDENTLIIHDSTLANQYLQSFAGSFENLGGTMGVDMLSDGSSISLYPNPAQDHIFIDIANVTGPVNADLTDLTGKALYTASLISDHTGISLARLATGTYLIKVSTQTSSKTYKVVKL